MITNYNNREYRHKRPDFPSYCRQCDGRLVLVREPDMQSDGAGRPCRVIANDVFTGEPRTWEYLVNCDKSDDHQKLVVVETPSVDFRAVITQARYDRRIVLQAVSKANRHQ